MYEVRFRIHELLHWSRNVIDNSVPIKSIKKYRSNSRENDVVIIGRFVQQNVFYMQRVIDELQRFKGYMDWFVLRDSVVNYKSA